MPEPKIPSIIFVPTPGDHYSLATGSATMSLIHELTRKQLAAGGEAQIIVGHDTRHDIPDGKCVEVHYPSSRTRRQKMIEIGLGRIGLPRVFERRLYRPVAEAIKPDFSGPVLVYNAPGAIGGIKKLRPRAHVCLYAVNALFRTYSRSEARRVEAAADRIIVCSQFIADDLQTALGRSSSKIRVVHNGVDTQRFRPAPREPGTNGDPVKILFIGRVVPEKGPDLLIKAARLLHGTTHPFKVRILGSSTFALISDLSPYEQELRALAEPIKEAIEFHPSISRSQLLQEYQSADIFCAPSNWDDPFPLTILEAMACGVPTVASRRGGIPEGGGENILYFSPPNAAELAERLAEFLKDSQTRSAWTARSRAQAERFDWQQQYYQLCRALTD